MVKVTGPMHSDTASGTYAGAITFTKNLGGACVRSRVIPKNPKTADQLANRSILATLAKAAYSVLTAAKDPVMVGSPFYTHAFDIRGAGNSWISRMQKTMYSLFAGRVTAYGLLSGTIKGYYDDAATTIGLEDHVSVDGVTHTAGEQLYMLAYYAVAGWSYTGFAAGIDEATALECTTFGTYVHSTTP